MESQSPDSYGNFYPNNLNFLNYTNNYLNPLEDRNKNYTNNLLFTNKNNFLIENNTNKIYSRQNEGPTPLSLDEKNSIILTRLIISAISFIACLICIIIYFCLCIKRTIESKKEKQKKAEMMNQVDDGSEDLDEIEEPTDDKKERFLTCEDMEEEKIENKKALRLSLASKKDNSEGISFENVIAQNKSVSFEKKVYNPYSSNQSSNGNSLQSQNDEIQIINPYERQDSNALRLSEASNQANLLKSNHNYNRENNYNNLNSKENLQTDIVNHYVTNQTHAINSDENAYFENTPAKSNQNPIQDQEQESSEDPSNYNDSGDCSDSYNSKPTFNVESKEEKKLKIGIINKILLLLIVTNLGFAACSFLITDATEIEDKQSFSSKCIPQALLQNFFDLSAICFTTVISQLMRCSQRYIILKKLTSRYKWYLTYSILMPLLLAFGPYFTNSYGSTGPWCWVDTDDDIIINIIWSYIIYFFCWANIGVISYKFYRLNSYFNSRCEEIKFNQNKIEERKYIKKSRYIMFAFPVILIISKFPATINRCIVLMLDENSPILFHFQASFSASIGFFNSLVFLYIHRRFILKKK